MTSSYLTDDVLPSEVRRPYRFLLSASQHDKWNTCPRRWAFRYIAKIKGEPHPSAVVGTRLHAIAEAYLRDGTMPNRNEVMTYTKTKRDGSEEEVTVYPGQLFEAGMKHLPKPGIAQVEKHFQFGSWQGYVDALWKDPKTGAPNILDHKTSADLGRYMKTVQALKKDPQALLYGRLSAADTVHLSWVYYETKYKNGKYRSKKVSLPLVKSDPDVVLNNQRLDKQADTMLRVYKARIDPLDLPFNINGCTAYGGCPHQTTCNLTDQDKIDGTIMSMSDDFQQAIDPEIQRLLQTTTPRPPAATPPPVAAPPVAAPPPATPALPPGVTPEMLAAFVAAQQADKTPAQAPPPPPTHSEPVQAASTPPAVNPPEAPSLSEPIPVAAQPAPPPPSKYDGIERDELKRMAVARGLIPEKSRMREKGLKALLEKADDVEIDGPWGVFTLDVAAFEAAPVCDEPVSAAEERQAEEARADISAGRVTPHAEVTARLENQPDVFDVAILTRHLAEVHSALGGLLSALEEYLEK